jgi:hypothetical protein
VEIEARFAPGFERPADDQPPADRPLPVLAGRGRWLAWRRPGAAAGAAEAPRVAS